MCGGGGGGVVIEIPIAELIIDIARAELQVMPGR